MSMYMAWSIVIKTGLLFNFIYVIVTVLDKVIEIYSPVGW